MNAKEARKCLNEIRIKYESYELTLKEALELGKPLVKIHNDKAMEIAKKYEVKPQLLSMNIQKWHN